MRFMLPLVLLTVVFATHTSAAPITIKLRGAATNLEQYAASELSQYLVQLTRQQVKQEATGETILLIGALSDDPVFKRFSPALPDTLKNQEFLVRSGSLDGQPAVVITGGSPQASLWAVYALLESLGCLFEFSGEYIPPIKDEIILAGINIKRSASLNERGLRLHLNFPMDQSAYSLAEFEQWVDRVARMKMNYLMFHFYSAHPWFYWEYRGAQTKQGTFFVGSYSFDAKYQLPPDMIGRAKIRNQGQFFPPEMEGMGQGVDLYLRTEERMRAVMRRCHERGIKVAVSFEPLSLPTDMTSQLDSWAKQVGGMDALWRDMTASRLQACMDAYPEADEYQLISVEGSSDAPAGIDLKQELNRLCDKYQIPFDTSDESAFAGTKEAGVHLTPYNDPAATQQLEQGLYLPVVSALRFVDLALDVLNNPVIATRLKQEGKQGNVGIYLPHANAVKLCTPALSVMMPPDSRLQMMVDYGARGTADQMPTWDALKGRNLQLGVISWLEFDGSMFMPQTWPRAVFDCVRNARDLPVTTLVGNHWRVSGLEADAACLAETPWMPDATYEEWLDDYMGRVFGQKNAELACAAYRDLERATLYCREFLFNVGFCWEGRWLSQGFGYNPTQLDEAASRFTRAQIAFQGLQELATTDYGRQRAAYMASRCACGARHMQVVKALGEAERNGGVGAENALSAAEGYMRQYAEFVNDRGDEGMLVNYQFGPLTRAKNMVETARVMQAVTSADPVKPLMAWNFDQPGASAWADATGNGFDAAPVGKIALETGKSGNAVSFDGESYLLVSSAAGWSPESFTVSAWIKPERVDNRRGIFVKRISNTASPLVFGIADGKLSLEGCDTTGRFWPLNFTGGEIKPGVWSHVAVTFEAKVKATLYVNGEAVATKAMPDSVPQLNSEPFVIGREAWGGEGGQGSPGFFRGLIDELKVWKRAMPPEEIRIEASR